MEDVGLGGNRASGQENRRHAGYKEIRKQGDIMNCIRTRVEIIQQLEHLATLASSSLTISDVAQELIDELGQLECDIENRAGVENGTIKEYA